MERERERERGREREREGEGEECHAMPHPLLLGIVRETAGSLGYQSRQIVLGC